MVDFDYAYKSVCVASGCACSACGVWKRCWHYFVVKRLNVGVLGSGFSVGRIAVLVVWIMAILGLGPELWVDERSIHRYHQANLLCAAGGVHPGVDAGMQLEDRQVRRLV